MNILELLTLISLAVAAAWSFINRTWPLVFLSAGLFLFVLSGSALLQP